MPSTKATDPNYPQKMKGGGSPHKGPTDPNYAGIDKKGGPKTGAYPIKMSKKR